MWLWWWMWNSCKYTKHSTVHFERLNLMVYELYLNKADTLKMLFLRERAEGNWHRSHWFFPSNFFHNICNSVQNIWITFITLKPEHSWTNIWGKEEWGDSDEIQSVYFLLHLLATYGKYLTVWTQWHIHFSSHIMMLYRV